MLTVGLAQFEGRRLEQW